MASQSREKKRPKVDDVSETDILKESSDVDDAWEDDSFKEFDEMMNKHDYFDTNLRNLLEPEIVNLLDRTFNEQGDERKTGQVIKNVVILPIYLPLMPHVAEFASFAVDFYNEKKKKDLQFDRVYKANSIFTVFGIVYLFTIDTLDFSSIKKRFQSCVIWPHDTETFEVLVWSFKPKALKALEDGYYKSDDGENEDGWETPDFKTWVPFNWDRLDYCRNLPCYKKEKEKEIMDLLKRHSSEVRNSKGFDVQTFPPSLYAWLSPLPEYGHPSKDDIDKAAKFALRAYNKKRVKRMRFLEVSKAYYCREHYILESDLLYFITFEVMDISTDEKKTCLTNVAHHKKSVMHVRYFKLKLRHEDNLGKW